MTYEEKVAAKRANYEKLAEKNRTLSDTEKTTTGAQVRVDKTTHKNLRILAAHEDTTQGEIVKRLVEAAMAKLKK